MGAGLAVLGLLACGRTALLLAPAPALAALDSSAVETTVFLIGDAGGTRAGGDPVLVELTRQARGAARASAIVFLGDNVYPAGIPGEGAAEYAEMHRRLMAQASLADSTGLPVYFVPGNHDWARHQEDGWAAVQRSDRLLRAYSAERKVTAKQLPAGGCPGPDLIDVGRSVRLVLIDTQWWLHSNSKPGRSREETRRALPDPDVRCGVTTEQGLADSLRRIFAAPDARLELLVAHHPLISHGEHGGWHPWIQYLMPVVPTPIAPWAWLPIGWIYPLGRRLVADRQDQASAVYRAMRRAIESTFSAGRPFVYASGHEHALEVLRHGPDRFYLVSGAGMVEHETAVGWSDSTAFASSRPGFMRVDVIGADSVRLGVTTIDRAGQAGEAYHAWLTP